MKSCKTSANIFTYGSLMYPEVMYRIVETKDYKTQPALLKGHNRLQVKGAIYPGLVKDQKKQVKGVLYWNVTQKDVKTLHRFEGDEYRAEQVIVEIQNGQKVKALAYLYGDPKNLENKEWDYETFEKNHKSTFATSHLSTR